MTKTTISQLKEGTTFQTASGANYQYLSMAYQSVNNQLTLLYMCQSLKTDKIVFKKGTEQVKTH